jgi:hypothetical protein
MNKIILIILALLSLASAHIPELVLEDRNYTNEPIMVEEPEISYAYYGKLQSSPQIYKIESEEPFYLYVSLLVPYVGQDETSDVEFHIMKDGEKIVMMHDYDNWTQWYEEYGGDWYLQGPTYEADVEAGVYLVEVHSDTNAEDYTLAIGNIESFGPTDIISTIFTLPLMKALFWNEYLMLVIYLALLALIFGVVVFFLRKKRKG